MIENEYILSIDELALQIHRVIKDLYPSLEISGDNIQAYLFKNDSDFQFLAKNFAFEFGLDPEKSIENIYLELMVEYEKNWHDRVFFKILKDDGKILFKKVNPDNK